MRDDQDFNIQFVGLIEKFPELYDYGSPLYHRTNAQNKAWNSISKEAKASVPDCKNRWRNLRGRFAKHHNLTESAKATRRPYYLADYMSFVIPFTKRRRLNVSDEEEGEDQTSDVAKAEVQWDIDIDSAYTLSSSSPAALVEEDAVLPTPRKKMREDDPTSSFVDANGCVLAEYKPCAQSEDADVSFLMSMLPDMRKMTEAQKRRFKIDVITCASAILE